MTPPPIGADRAVQLLLRLYREPAHCRTPALHAEYTQGNSELILRIALGRAVGITSLASRDPGGAAELELAAALFVRQVFFQRDATHYEILGLARHADAGAIRENYRLLMQLTHPDRNAAKAGWPEDCAARVNRAYAVLRNPDARAAYDRRLPSPADSTAPSARHLRAPRQPAGDSARRVRRLPPRPILPEWLTAGVGGFLWRHPAMAIFAALIIAATMTVGLVAWRELDGFLVSEAPALPASRAGVNSKEIEALLATFISSYESGRLDTLAGLFDEDAQLNLRHGRAAIRSEYQELFERSAWRRMNLARLRPQSNGEHVQASGPATVTIEWLDGRESEQRLAVDMEFVHRDGRALIARLFYRPEN